MENSKSNQVSKYSYAYLLIGFVFLFFVNGRWILPIASFVAPLFLIRFLRYQKPIIGFLLIVLAGWISNIFIWEGMMPVSGPFYYVLAFMMSLITSLVFLIDRVYSPKFKGFISTLIFPSAYVIMEFITILTNPSGSYGTLAHTQSSLPMLQILSVTGVWGLVFLITWTSSMINWLWDNSFERKKLNIALLVYGVPVFFILLFGQARILNNTQNETVRIASVNISKDALQNRHNANIDSIAMESNNNFLAQCDITAASGAKIVFGIETVVSLPKNREAEFIERAKLAAHSNSIYIGLPMEVIPEGFPAVRPENKITWISPQGQILYSYHKAKPTPGEGSYGDGVIKYFDSPYGRISSTICFDMDFPNLINQVGDMGIDIMLVPGNDWEEITPYHTFVASARAIEHGFNMVRAASRGLSASFSYKGEVLSSMDYFKTNEFILYSDVPTEGHRTVYSILGDYFAWLCILFFVIISVIFFGRKGVLGTKPKGFSIITMLGIITITYSCNSGSAQLSDKQIVVEYYAGLNSNDFNEVKGYLSDSIVTLEGDYVVTQSIDDYYTYFQWDSVFAPSYQLVDLQQMDNRFIATVNKSCKRIEFLLDTAISYKVEVFVDNGKIYKLQTNNYLVFDFEKWQTRRDSLTQWIETNQPHLSGFVNDMTKEGAKNT
jgi:apolipoprotein N-acyltransferase